jgi:hypothetical protein
MHKVIAAALTGAALLAGLTGTASAQTDFPWPPKDVTPVHKTKAELRKQADEFSAHQHRSYPEIFPGASNVDPSPWGGGEAGDVYEDMQYMDSRVHFTYQGKLVMTYTKVNAPGEFRTTPEQLCERVPCDAKVSDNKGGLIVTARHESYGVNAAWNFRPNGEVVWTQASLQENLAQLAMIASDRAYTFTR